MKRVSKFRASATVFNPAYILDLYGMSDFHHSYFKANIKLREIIVQDVKGYSVTGIYFDRYANVKNHPGLVKLITNKKKIVKGKPVDFLDSDMVTIKSTWKEGDLLTLDEAKLKMIGYIAHDFSDACDGSCGG